MKISQQEFLPALKKGMDAAGVKLIGCAKTQEIIDVTPADDGSWDMEYLDYIMSVRVVASTMKP